MPRYLVRAKTDFEEHSSRLFLFSGCEVTPKGCKTSLWREGSGTNPGVFMSADRLPDSAMPGEDVVAFSGRTGPLSAEVIMGRSVFTFHQQIEQEKRSWNPFRAHLSRAEQEVMDWIFEISRLYPYAGGEISDRPRPFNVLLLSFVLDLARRIEALEAELRRRP